MTAQLVTDALVMAIWGRGKLDALVHDSDRGSQYSSEQFQRLMADHGVVCSMSRSWRRGTMRRWKRLLVAQDRACGGEDVEEQRRGEGLCVRLHRRFYIARRRHSTIRYLSPMEFRAQGRVRLRRPNGVQATFGQRLRMEADSRCGGTSLSRAFASVTPSCGSRSRGHCTRMGRLCSRGVVLRKRVLHIFPVSTVPLRAVSGARPFCRYGWRHFWEGRLCRRLRR